MNSDLTTVFHEKWLISCTCIKETYLDDLEIFERKEGEKQGWNQTNRKYVVTTACTFS